MMILNSGAIVDVLALEWSRVDLEDLAFSLFEQKRWCGHAEPGITIGEHCLAVARGVRYAGASLATQLLALHHPRHGRVVLHARAHVTNERLAIFIRATHRIARAGGRSRAAAGSPVTRSFDRSAQNARTAAALAVGLSGWIREGRAMKRNAELSNTKSGPWSPDKGDCKTLEELAERWEDAARDIETKHRIQVPDQPKRAADHERHRTLQDCASELRTLARERWVAGTPERPGLYLCKSAGLYVALRWDEMHFWAAQETPHHAWMSPVDGFLAQPLPQPYQPTETEPANPKDE